MTVSRAYLALAAERRAVRSALYGQPEDHGYDFTSWVSPYTKGANMSGGIALVLQDWASAEGLGATPNPEIQLHGRAPWLLTTKRLQELLARVLGTSLNEIYATNVFPFVKQGRMSAPLPYNEVLATARRFAVPELELARPSAVLALGTVAAAALRKCGVQATELPHPAARIGGIAVHEAAWRAALQASGVAVLAERGAVV